MSLAQEFAEIFGGREVRWYQIAARNATIQALREGIMRIAIVSPTGSGKTLTISCTLNHPDLREVLGIDGDRPLRVLFLSHRHRLLTQAEREFAHGFNVQLIPQSIFSDIPDSVIEEGWDIAVQDECHHEACFSLQKQLIHIGEKPFIGLTATYDRADNVLCKFQRVVEVITREQAIAEGYLARTWLYSIVDPSSKDKSQLVIDTIKQYHTVMENTLVFVRTKVEAASIATWLEKEGHSVALLDKQTPKQIDVILDDFSAGKYDFVINCHRLSEGIDVRNCTDVIVAKQVNSYPMLNQIVGRASRPDSVCRVWEFINPLKDNLDTTCIVGTPESHKLCYVQGGTWHEQEFNYVS